MESPMKGICAISLLTGLAALAASCGPKEPADGPPAPTASASVSAAPVASASASAAPDDGPDLNDPSNVAIGSWTDDDAVKALAKDCHWDPGGCFKAMGAAAATSVDVMDFLPEGEERPQGDTRVLPPAACQGLWPLACARVPSQSCAPDECSQTDYTCVPACDKGCESCAAKCVSGCESCKSKCTDDACRLKCAESCGECRNTCLVALDQCTSAGCAEESETCFRERDDQWNASTCPKVCTKVAACVEKCPEIENDWTGQRYYSECANKCFSKLGKGCPDRFARICAGDPNASVNFFAYQAARKGGAD